MCLGVATGADLLGDGAILVPIRVQPPIGIVPISQAFGSFMREPRTGSMGSPEWRRAQTARSPQKRYEDRLAALEGLMGWYAGQRYSDTGRAGRSAVGMLDRLGALYKKTLDRGPSGVDTGS